MSNSEQYEKWREDRLKNWWKVFKYAIAKQGRVSTEVIANFILENPEVLVTVENKPDTRLMSNKKAFYAAIHRLTHEQKAILNLAQVVGVDKLPQLVKIKDFPARAKLKFIYDPIRGRLSPKIFARVKNMEVIRTDKEVIFEMPLKTRENLSDIEKRAALSYGNIISQGGDLDWYKVKTSGVWEYGKHAEYLIKLWAGVQDLENIEEDTPTKYKKKKGEEEEEAGFDEYAYYELLNEIIKYSEEQLRINQLLQKKGQLFNPMAVNVYMHNVKVALELKEDIQQFIEDTEGPKGVRSAADIMEEHQQIAYMYAKISAKSEDMIDTNQQFMEQELATAEKSTFNIGQAQTRGKFKEET